MALEIPPSTPLFDSLTLYIKDTSIDCDTKYREFLNYKKLYYTTERANLNEKQKAIFSKIVKKVGAILHETVDYWTHLSYCPAFYVACSHLDIMEIIQSVQSVPPSLKTRFYNFVANNVEAHIPSQYRPLRWETMLEDLIRQPVSEHLPEDIRTSMIGCFTQLTIRHRCEEFTGRLQELHTPPKRPLPLAFCIPSLFYALRFTEESDHDEIHTNLLDFLLAAFLSHPLNIRAFVLQTFLSHSKHPSVIPPLIRHARILFQDLVDPLTQYWSKYETNEQLEILHDVVSSLHSDLRTIPEDKREDVQEEKRFLYIGDLISQIKPLQTEDYVLLAALWDDLYGLYTTVEISYNRFEGHVTGLACVLARHCNFRELENTALYLLLEGIEDEQEDRVLEMFCWMDRIGMFENWHFGEAVCDAQINLEKCSALRSGFPQHGDLEADLFVNILAHPEFFTYTPSRDSVVVALLKRVYFSEEGRQTLTPHIPWWLSGGIRENFLTLAQFADLDFSP